MEDELSGKVQVSSSEFFKKKKKRNGEILKQKTNIHNLNEFWSFLLLSQGQVIQLGSILATDNQISQDK